VKDSKVTNPDVEMDGLLDPNRVRPSAGGQGAERDKEMSDDDE
jgi:hypothetical protein